MGETPPDADADLFGALLREYRASANLTQEELAARAGLSVQAVSMLERGVRRTPRSRTVELLARAMQLDAAQRQALVAAARQMRTRQPPVEAGDEGAAAAPVDTGMVHGQQPGRGREPARAGPVGGLRWRARTLRPLSVLLAAALLALVVLPSDGSNRLLPRRSNPRAAGDTGRAQVVAGPAWVEAPPVLLSPKLFGLTVGRNTGEMPGFRIGAVRFWDSRTRWANVEPDRGRFTWNLLDRLVAGAESAGLPSLYTLGMAPGWSNPGAPQGPYDDGSITAPPLDLGDWDLYVQGLLERYRGRIEAYELWNLANSTRYYSGSVETLVELTRRASSIIRGLDPRATIVCPSMGELWQPGARDFVSRFAALDGYRYCDIAGVKLHPRTAHDRPETVIELADLVYRTLHLAEVNLALWSTSNIGYDFTAQGMLSAWDAGNYAVRTFLMSIYLRPFRYERMYFYAWGSGQLPIVLQGADGPPTEAGRFLDRLQRWLAGARVRSCGRGTEDGLPSNVWECRFVVPGAHGGSEAAVIRWTDRGTASVLAEPAAYVLEQLNGDVKQVRSGDMISLSERPVLVRLRTVL